MIWILPVLAAVVFSFLGILDSGSARYHWEIGATDVLFAGIGALLAGMGATGVAFGCALACGIPFRKIRSTEGTSPLAPFEDGSFALVILKPDGNSTCFYRTRGNDGPISLMNHCADGRKMSIVEAKPDDGGGYAETFSWGFETKWASFLAAPTEPGPTLVLTVPEGSVRHRPGVGAASSAGSAVLPIAAAGIAAASIASLD